MAITEDYVSFEVAKLLKEKGFNEECNSYFISDNEIALISNKRDFNNHGIYLFCSYSSNGNEVVEN